MGKGYQKLNPGEQQILGEAGRLGEVLPFIPGAGEMGEADELTDGVFQASSAGVDGTSSGASDVVTTWGRFEGQAEPGPNFMESEGEDDPDASGDPGHFSRPTRLFGDSDAAWWESDPDMGGADDHDFAPLELKGNGGHDVAPMESTGNNDAGFPDDMASTEEYNRALLRRTLEPLPPLGEGMEGLASRLRENFPATFTIEAENRVLTLRPDGWELEL
jgi:hypothetical protein